MEILELKAQKRDSTGKGAARALRRSGMIPAVVYGFNHAAESLAVNARELENVLKSIKTGKKMFNLVIQNGTSSTNLVMVKGIQKHPLSNKFLHADFYAVSMDRKIRVRVPVTTKGKCLGVELGGSLQIIRRELEVLCLPAVIPERIEIDVTKFNVGHVVHVKDIQIEGDVEIPAEVNFTVLTVLGKASEVVKTEEEEPAEEEEAEA